LNKSQFTVYHNFIFLATVGDTAIRSICNPNLDK